jgi:ribosomal protein S12 methylthiotransferase accessory factor
LQNNVLFKEEFLFFASRYSGNSFPFKDLELDFIEYPDEVLFSVEDTLSNFIVQHLKNLDKGGRLLEKIKNNQQLRIFTPFYDVFNNKVELLPILLIKRFTTSNGMCAGNTPKEAIIQGISEILERYAIKKIYFDKITPPDIPVELFEGTNIYRQIKLMEEKSGFKIIIKDCSLGLSLPIIGILIIDKRNNKYCFHLGADPSPITALERSLSELFQGFNPKKFKDICISNNAEINDIEKNLFKHYSATIINGTGQWPNSIFNECFTYEFTGFENYISGDDDTDLSYLFKILKRQNYDVFIRDVSFLGFPSYFIFIPGMSENYEEIFSVDNNLIITANNILKSKKQDLVTLSESIVRNKKFDNLLFYNLNYDLKELDSNLFLVMLFYYMNDIKNSYLAIVKYLENNNDNNDRIYFFCIRDFLWFKLNNIGIDRIHKELMKLYETEIVDIVFLDFASSHKIFKHFNLPNCFNCNECMVVKNCLMKNILKIVKKIHEFYKLNDIKQENLANILKGGC